MAETLTPQEIAEKQARRLKGSTQDIIRGIERVTEAPGVKAAAKADKMLTNLTEAVTSGKWAANVGAVPLDDWKKSTIEKGVPRISAGIDAAIPKMTDFHQQRQAHQQGIDSELDRMADISLEDGIQRATHQMRRMSEMRFKR